MRPFIKRLLIFLLPLLLTIGFFEICFLEKKETTPISTVIENQMNSKREQYYLRQYFSSSPVNYKLMMAEKKKADILIIGQSTVLQFRDFMFHPFEKSFYNMGKSVSNLNELESLINLIKNKVIYKPKLIILGFDFALVKSNYFGANLNSVTQPFTDEVNDPNYHISSIQLLLRSYFNKNNEATQKFDGLGYGYWGSKGTGFRKDGSMHYAETIAKYLNGKTRRNDQYKGLVNTGGFIFTKPYVLDSVRITRFFSILDKIKSLNIDLLVYLPPYSDSFYKFLSEKKDLNSCVQAYLSLQKLLKKKHIKTIAFTTPALMGLNDDYMLDSIHPGEVYIGTAFYKYLSTVSKDDFLATIDKSFLKKQLDAKATNALSFMRDTQVFSMAYSK